MTEKLNVCRLKNLVQIAVPKYRKYHFFFCIIHQRRKFSFKLASSILSITVSQFLQKAHTVIIFNKTNVSVPMNFQQHQFVQLNNFLNHKVRMEKENSWIYLGLRVCQVLAIRDNEDIGKQVDEVMNHKLNMEDSTSKRKLKIDEKKGRQGLEDSMKLGN